MLRTLSALFACALCISVTFAQPGNRGQGSSRLPAVGTVVPDVNVFDAEGNVFSTKTLREHYSVLVFGCLT